MNRISLLTTFKKKHLPKQFKAEPAQSMRPLNERVGPTDPFNAMSTHRADFIERQNAREKPCPAEVVINKKSVLQSFHIKIHLFRNNNYQHVGQKDGHRFYKRVGLNSGSGGNRELTRIIG